MRGGRTMHLNICPIGYVENNIGKQSDENWGRVISSIRLKDDYIGGLSGLEDFSHVMILTYLHEAQFVNEKHLKRHPRNLADMIKWIMQMYLNGWNV